MNKNKKDIARDIGKYSWEATKVMGKGSWTVTKWGLKMVLPKGAKQKGRKSRWGYKGFKP